MLTKKYILDIIDFIRYKVDNDLCTPEELESVAKAVEKDIVLYGTAEDIAKFYDKSQSAVRTELSRNVLDKPKRRVFHRFDRFCKSVADKWNKNKHLG